MTQRCDAKPASLSSALHPNATAVMYRGWDSFRSVTHNVTHNDCTDDPRVSVSLVITDGVPA